MTVGLPVFYLVDLRFCFNACIQLFPDPRIVNSLYMFCAVASATHYVLFKLQMIYRRCVSFGCLSKHSLAQHIYRVCRNQVSCFLISRYQIFFLCQDRSVKLTFTCRTAISICYIRHKIHQNKYKNLYKKTKNFVYYTYSRTQLYFTQQCSRNTTTCFGPICGPSSGWDSTYRSAIQDVWGVFLGVGGGDEISLFQYWVAWPRAVTGGFFLSCLCTQNSLLLIQHNGDDAPQDYLDKTWTVERSVTVMILKYEQKW